MDSKNLNIKLQKEEVDAAAWINESFIKEVLQELPIKMKFDAIELSNENIWTTTQLEAQLLQQKFTNKKLEVNIYKIINN